MKEMKILGRGGQGAVTGAQILATAAFLEGYWAQTFPQFGAERRGAPVIAYVRVAREPIRMYGKVYAPDIVIVMDFNLFKMADPLAGMKPEGIVFLNYPDRLELPVSLVNRVGHLFTIDATTIAHQLYGKTAIPITNVIIAGAFCAAQNDISLESISKALPDFFPPDKLEINRKAAQMGFESLRGR